MESIVKILHVVSQLSTGGIETWLLNVYKKINRDKYIFVFITSSLMEGTYDSEFLHLGAKIYYYKSSKNPYIIYNRVKQIIREEQIDIIHTHVYTYNSIYSLLGKYLNIPVISHSHTTRTYNNIIKIIYHYWSTSIINKYANLKLACSTPAGKTLYKGSPFEILPYGIDTNLFNPSNKTNSAFTMNKIVIGHVGRFLDVKNQSFILDLALNLNSELYHFYLIGDGPDKIKIKDKIISKNLTNITLLDSRKDIEIFMVNVFDIFILPSKFEGLGIVLLEAQSSGTPVIVSEFIPNEAMVYPPLFHSISINNVDDWVKFINKFTLPNEILQKCSNQAVEQSKYSIYNSVKELENIYHKIYMNNADST